MNKPENTPSTNESAWKDDFFIQEMLKTDEAFESVSSYLLTYSMAEREIPLPVDRGNISAALLKEFCMNAEGMLQRYDESTAENREKEWHSSFSHMPKHLYLSMILSPYCEDFRSTALFQDLIGTLERISLILRDYHSAERIYECNNMPEEAAHCIKLQADHAARIQRILKSKHSNEHYTEEYDAYFASKEEITLAIEMTREWIKNFRQHPWYEFDMEAYLADQKRQWDEAKQEM